MGYTDAHGRPELVAQPFIKRGAAVYRTVGAGTSDQHGGAGAQELLQDDPQDADR